MIYHSSGIFRKCLGTHRNWKLCVPNFYIDYDIGDGLEVIPTLCSAKMPSVPESILKILFLLFIFF